MRCPVCSAPLVYDPTNGETFCNDDPSHSYWPPEELEADG